MPRVAQNVAAAFAAVLIVATSMAHVVTVPPPQAAVAVTPQLA